MPSIPSFSADPDLGAVFFLPGDASELTAALSELLQAAPGPAQQLVWVERIDLATSFGSVALFFDEDGSSHLELTGLDAAARAALIARLEAAVRGTGRAGGE